MMKLLLFLILSSAQAKTLVISDSHGTGAFGEELTKLIENNNEDLSFYAFGGTKAVDWIEGNNLTWGYWEHHTGKVDKRGTNRATPKLEELIQIHHPSLVIINLGTNMVWKQPSVEQEFQIKTIIETAKSRGAECVWSGPPDLNASEVNRNNWVEQIHQMLIIQTQLHGCKLLKGWELTNYPEGKGDGVHYDAIPGIGKKLARDWARKMFKLLE